MAFSHDVDGNSERGDLLQFDTNNRWHNCMLVYRLNTRQGLTIEYRKHVQDARDLTSVAIWVWTPFCTFF